MKTGREEVSRGLFEMIRGRSLAESIYLGGVSKASKGNAGGCVGLAFGGVFTLVGVAFLVFTIKHWFDEAMTRTWSKVPCGLESCEIVDHGPKEESSFEITGHFSYEFEGQVFESTRIRSKSQGENYYEDLSLLRRELFEESREGLFCYVNPSDPTEAILRRGSLLSSTLFLLFPLPFVGFGLLALFASLKSLRAKREDGLESLSGQATFTAKHGRYGRWIGVAFFGVFALAGMGFGWFFCFKPMLKAQQAESWLEVPCEIVWSTLRRNDGDSDSGPTYRPDIFFRYELDGEVYHSNSHTFLRSSSSERRKHQATVRQYAAGTQQLCYVDPELPERAVLQREVGWSWVVLIPLLFMSIGLGGVYYSLRKKEPAFSGGSPTETKAMFASHPQKEAAVGPHILKPETSRSVGFVMVLVIALFWNGIVSLFASEVISGWRDGSPEWFLTLFLIPFLMVGLGLIVGVVCVFLSLFNPTVEVTLSRHPVVGGKPVRLSWEMSGTANRIRRFRVSIEAEESATYSQGTGTRTDKETFYVHTVIETASSLEMYRGSGECVLPEFLPPSFESENNKIVWKARVIGEIAWWPNIEEDYPIEVIASDTLS